VCKKGINIKNNKYSQAILFLSGNNGGGAAVAACAVVDSEGGGGIDAKRCFMCSGDGRPVLF